MSVPLCHQWWKGHRWGPWEVVEARRLTAPVSVNGVDTGERGERGMIVRQRRKCQACGYEQYDEQEP